MKMQKCVTGGTSGISGRGLFTTESIKKGEVVVMLKGKRVSDEELDVLLEKKALRWDDPLQIGTGAYLILDELSVLANHSCDPNTGVRGKSTLVALRNIKKGEEVTYDYSTTVGMNAEWESDWFMTCSCGTKKCRKKVGNWQTLSPRRLAYYVSHDALPNHVLKQMKLVDRRG